MQNQVIDNPKLLKLMLEDTRSAPTVYQPTNYWAVYERRFVPELEELGLKDFRRRQNSVLSSFGATDLSKKWMIDFINMSPIFSNRFINRVPFWFEFKSFLNSVVDKIVRIFPSYLEYVRKSPYKAAKLEGARVGARSLDEFEASLVGNPEDIIEIDGRYYTNKIIYYYLRYVYCSRFINFDNVVTLVELGCGSGKQVELLKKLHPEICFFIFDIPPQLYVCEQYLSSVFPDSVVSYEKTRSMDSIPRIEKGKIFIFGNHKFPIIGHLDVDLFWNAASFQEMEPDVVSNYLRYVNAQARYVYLQEKMDGKGLNTEPGKGGVLKQTVLRAYIQGLSNFELIDMSTCNELKHKLIVSPFRRKAVKLKTKMQGESLKKHVLGKAEPVVKGYKDSFWQRR